MCVGSEQPSYIFYYICDLFYQFLSGFFCLSFTYLHTLHNQYTANIYCVTNTVFFCCVPFFNVLLLHVENLFAIPSLAVFMYHGVTVQRNVYGKYSFSLYLSQIKVFLFAVYERRI